MDAILAAIGASGLASFLRSSEYVYPLVNAAHILGIALLVGTIAALDARILGFARQVPLADAARLLLPFTAGGLVLAIASGAALFSVKPAEYWSNPVFLTKLGLVGAAVLNALSLRLRPAWQGALAGGSMTASLRLSAGLSLASWTAALVAGRLIAFFGY